MKHTTFFAGSFDPFTIGHRDIVERALTMFGRVVIGVGYNIKKQGHRPVEERVEAIRRVFEDDDRIVVTSYSGLTAEAARAAGAHSLLRGVRDIRDFEFERTMADVNRRLFGIDTVLLVADPTLSSVSSSMVRELEANGCDVSRFLP